MALENEIILKNQEGQILASSLDISEHFEKNHRDVLETIRNLTAENSAVKNMFIETTYINSRGREYPEYLLTRDGFSLLVMGFTGSKALEWKLKYIEAFNKMESMLQNPTQSYMIQDPIERAKAWIKEQEEKQTLEHQVKELEPARIFREAIGNSQDGILVRDMAKLLAQNGAKLNGKTIGEKNLRIWLKENGYMNRNNMPSQKSIDLKIMRVIERPYYDPKINETKYKATTYIIGKGQTYFINKFLN